MTGELYVFTREKDSTRMALKDVRSIEKLNGIYVRSFTIMGDEIYFVSGNSTIIRARLKDLKILEEYPVPPEIAGMVQLTKIQDYFYITVSTDADFNQDYATFIRTRICIPWPAGIMRISILILSAGERPTISPPLTAIIISRSTGSPVILCGSLMWRIMRL